MKKTVAWGIFAFLAVFSFFACGQKGESPRSDSSQPLATLNLIPQNVMGVMVMDVHRIMATSLAVKAIQDEKNNQKYQDFIKETGIDPQKDIFFVALGMSAASGSTKEDGAVVVSLNYKKDPLLAQLKKGKGDIKEETYNGVTVYTAAQSHDGKPASGAFLDDSHIVLGSEGMVKSVIDVFQKKADNVLKNETLSAVIKKTDNKAMVWSAFAIPPEAAKKVSSQNPMFSGLEDLKALTMYFDYKNKTFNLEIKTAGGEEAKNKQLADMLTGFKAMGAGAAAKNPDIGDLLNRIEISSGADFIRIYAGLPEELLERLSKSAAEKAKGLVKSQGDTEEKTEN